MSKQPNHQADISNGNWGTPGTNKTWDQAQGNRGKQMNPNQRPEGQAQQSSNSQGGPSGTHENRK